jgi:hypothetical protein
MADQKLQLAPHEELLLETSQIGWAQWRHNPLTAAFFAFLGDQEENFVQAIMARFLAGQLYREEAGESQEQNATVLRGRVISLRETQGITLEAIQAFYRDKLGLPQEDDDQRDGRGTGSGPA